LGKHKKAKEELIQQSKAIKVETDKFREQIGKIDSEINEVQSKTFQ